ncbi:MAG: hypothetical protein JXB00_01640 [Bacteroidales bacterium]|nr:hypothetical protein [Bacteroidales bacterium]
MKRYFLLIIIALNSLQGFTKQINPNDYVLLTIETIKESSILSSGDIDTLFINTNGLSFNTSDTVINSAKLIFTKSKEELFFWGVKFWFETIRFDYTGNNVDYGFCLNSWHDLDDFDYISGSFDFIKTNDKWQLDNKKVSHIDFDKIPKLDSPLVKQPLRPRRNYVECYCFDLKKNTDREFDNLADTLIGNWYSTADSTYTEYLFLNDSIYQYSALMGKDIPVSYDLKNRDLVITRYNGETFRLSIDKIDFNTIRLHGIDTVQYDNSEPEIYNIEYIIHRIPDSEFTFSDIKCWKEIETKKGRYKTSKDLERYRKGFMERQFKAYE